jgi:hypothetical protein
MFIYSFICEAVVFEKVILKIVHGQIGRYRFMRIRVTVTRDALPVGGGGHLIPLRP